MVSSAPCCACLHGLVCSMLRVLLQTSYSGSASLLDISWPADDRVHAPLARMCARVDYVNGLQQELEGQRATSQEVREEFAALVEVCREALKNRTDEND
jgi:hypothetical protein